MSNKFLDLDVGLPRLWSHTLAKIDDVISPLQDSIGSLEEKIGDTSISDLIASSNAASATKLETARTIQTNLASNSAVSFDGTANITPGVTGKLSIANGGTNAASAADARGNLLVTSNNRITSTDDDTVANWALNGLTISYFWGLGQLVDQPSEYGYLLNINNGATENHQIWTEQTNGSLYHRGGNSSGWSGTWKKILDSSNYSSYALPLTGGNLSGSLRVVNDTDNNDGTIGVRTTYTEYDATTTQASLFMKMSPISTGDESYLKQRGYIGFNTKNSADDSWTNANWIWLTPDSTSFGQPLTLASGGTGATSAAGARTNLGIPSITYGSSLPSSANLGDIHLLYN